MIVCPCCRTAPEGVYGKAASKTGEPFFMSCECGRLMVQDDSTTFWTSAGADSMTRGISVRSDGSAIQTTIGEGAAGLAREKPIPDPGPERDALLQSLLEEALADEVLDT